MIVLERFCYAPRATLGYLRISQGRTLYTLEQPWRDNRIGESCIREGRYSLVNDDQGQHQWFRIPDEEVAPRSDIEVHIANEVHELRGCIALGMGLWEDRMVLQSSREACELLAAEIEQYETLWIRHWRPEGVGG